jgi:hypothetical protein
MVIEGDYDAATGARRSLGRGWVEVVVVMVVEEGE